MPPKSRNVVPAPCTVGLVPAVLALPLLTFGLGLGCEGVVASQFAALGELLAREVFPFGMLAAVAQHFLARWAGTTTAPSHRR